MQIVNYCKSTRCHTHPYKLSEVRKNHLSAHRRNEVKLASLTADSSRISMSNNQNLSITTKGSVKQSKIHQP